MSGCLISFLNEQHFLRLMAVKLSSYYWFRNNYLMLSLEDKYRERAFFNKELSSEDRKTLKFIIEELDKLKEGSNFQQGNPLISEHLIIPNVVELKDATIKPELAALYLQGIHKIMEKYWVQMEMYRQLSNCFDELNIKPPKDIADAIEHAMYEMSLKRFASLDHMCWSKEKKSK